MIRLIREILGLGMPCMFHKLTGLYCPGCGGTRAVRSLLAGNLLMSAQYHPLVVYAVLVGLLEAVSWLGARIWGRPRLYIRRYDVFIIIGAVLVIVNWIFKNYMLIVQGVDLLPLM